MHSLGLTGPQRDLATRGAKSGKLDSSRAKAREGMGVCVDLVDQAVVMSSSGRSSFLQLDMGKERMAMA